MKQAKWMWNAGNFELYHNMLLHNRRTVHIADGKRRHSKFLTPVEKSHRQMYHNTMWGVDGPNRNLRLYKTATLTGEETFTFYSNCTNATAIINGDYIAQGETVILSPGEYSITIVAHKDGGFPAVYCTGDTFASDESWMGVGYDGPDLPAGTNDMYLSPEDDPEIFKFCYERIRPVSTEQVNGGTLYDFGREQFGKLIFENITPPGHLEVFCGESVEEALDTDWSVIYLDIQAENGSYVSDSIAFRYVYVPQTQVSFDLSADFEFLPLEDKGSFRCDDELINKLWDTCAYTLHLNAREGFFDGIKRDRWVWAGDAYQSYFVNYYLMNDREIFKRTQRILNGSGQRHTHINMICDYTFYWIIATWDYYFHTGDLQFVQEIYPAMCSTMDFIRSRLAEDGQYTRRDGDWVFMDWSSFDSTGPLCAEQMLLCHAYRCFAKCAALLGDDVRTTQYNTYAAELNALVNRNYWDGEKGGFVDDYRTGNRNITRHANIFALLFDLTTEERKAQIIRQVILNPRITPITTPYFEFYELDAMCRLGNFSYMTDMLHNYWGGMLQHGATTIWEEYFPEKSRVENYAMYGRPYDKSLCHAWGASPIYLLGKYALGVRPTAPAYTAFEVVPNLMCFGSITGKVPTPYGVVEVTMDRTSVTVRSDSPGGTLVLGDRRYPIEANVPLTVAL